MGVSTYDATPSAVECDDYYPFGESISCGATGTTTHKFTGYERDAESNLDNAQARYFSSPMGRFMSPDPAGNFVADATNPQTWNMYAYVNNNPLAFVDPTGTDSTACEWSNAAGCIADSNLGDFGGGSWNAYDDWNAQTSPSGSGQGGAPQVPCADDPNCTFQDTMNGTWWDTTFGPQNQNYGGAAWNDYELHATFGSNYYNLPGYGDPVAQALEQYNKQVAQARYDAVLQDSLIAGNGLMGKLPEPFWKWARERAIHEFCGTSPSNGILLSMRNGAVKGAFAGAVTGGVAAGIPSGTLGTLPGAIAGGVVGGIFGASSGVFVGAGAVAVCSVAGVY